MKKIKVGDTICVFDETLTKYYGRVGEVREYIHPYVYVVRFKEGDEGWFMHYQIQKGASLN